jgi:hypothetical protein
MQGRRQRLQGEKFLQRQGWLQNHREQLQRKEWLCRCWQCLARKNHLNPGAAASLRARGENYDKELSITDNLSFFI